MLVALLIGGLEALGLIASQLGLEGRFWNAVGDLNDDLANFGFVVVGIFALCRIVSTAIYRWKRFGELEPHHPTSGPSPAA